MLLHVVPMSECLLFVSYSYDNNRKFTYGSPNGCYAAGVLPLVVAVGAIGLMFVQVMMMMIMMIMMMTCLQYLQLTKLRDHLRNPEMSSDEYRYNCRYSTVQCSTDTSTVQYSTNTLAGRCSGG